MTAAKTAYRARVEMLVGRHIFWALGGILLLAFLLRLVARAASGSAFFWKNS